MPYNSITLGAYVNYISELMDDPGQVYWTASEIQSAIREALRVWGAYTNYWRTRGPFNVLPTNPTPYYDMSVVLPALRPRTTVLGDVVKEIQSMLLETDSGVAGTGMSGQIDAASITQALQVSRNKFVLDTRLPIHVHDVPASPPPPSGMLEFDQTSVFVHRASWMDAAGGAWNNLWRQDVWAADRGSPLWTLNPGQPIQFSEAENAPLKIQLVPPPQATGKVEVLTVDSLQMPINVDASPFLLPDEWIHAVKYAALSYILNGEGQIKDTSRGQYAESRYQQAVDMAKNARSIFRLMSNNVPLNVDTLFNIDAGFPYWRNQTGPPQVAGLLYDIAVIAPGLPDQVYGITADVVQSAPVPLVSGDFMPVGVETLDCITDYVSHILSFKCGGQDFSSSYPGYDSFMSAVSKQEGVNKAKIQYLTPLLGVPQREWAQRPDRIESSTA